MRRGINPLAVVFLIGAVIAAFVLAFYVRGILPEEWERWSALIFWGIVIVVGGARSTSGRPAVWKEMTELEWIEKPQFLKGVIGAYTTSLTLALRMAAVSASAAASGADVISQGFDGLLSIVTALISSIGTIILLWGLFEWGLSLQGQDGFTQSTAFKRIGGGIVMILAPQLLNIFLIQP